MTEGHPAFVANNGRIGFGADDYAAYAPEAGADVRLLWLARTPRSEAHLSLAHDVDERALYRGRARRRTSSASFEARLRDLGLDPADYLYLPVHPWQWDAPAGDHLRARRRPAALVPLGEGADAHRAQQSIRTFFPIEHPDAVLREGRAGDPEHGVPARPVAGLHGRDAGHQRLGRRRWSSGDETLAGVRVLGAARARRDRLDRATSSTGCPAPRRTARCSRRCGARARCRGWRRGRAAGDDGLAAAPRPRRRGARGRAGRGRRGCRPRSGCATYLRAYLRPLVHCLLAHDLAFMPHGENLVMVLDGHVPTRMLMKDIGEEVAVMGDRPLPRRGRAHPRRRAARRARAGDPHRRLRRVPAPPRGDPRRGRRAVRRTTSGGWCATASPSTRAEHPELAEAARRTTCCAGSSRTAASTGSSCATRCRWSTSTDQAESLIFAGELANPISSRRLSRRAAPSRNQASALADA